MSRERRPRLRPARGAADLVELVHGGEAAQRIGAHGADADQAEHPGAFGPTHLQASTAAAVLRMA